MAGAESALYACLVMYEPIGNESVPKTIISKVK